MFMFSLGMGTFAFIGRDAIIRRTGTKNYLLAAPALQPLPNSMAHFAYFVKDLLFYVLLILTPIIAGMALGILLDGVGYGHLLDSPGTEQVNEFLGHDQANVPAPEKPKAIVHRFKQITALHNADIEVVQDEQRSHQTKTDGQNQAKQDGEAALAGLCGQSPQQEVHG